MTDMKSFRLGENIATTPGKVVYQNDLMQLIQYEPSTPDVRRRPLLIVPPWINKFYVLDLQPKNSFIKWCVDQGHTVFVISWVNPDERLAQKSFEDYMLEGPLAALDAIDAATGERSVNAVGYCLGGTLLASTLAYLAAHGDDRIASATYFVTLVDFTDVGDMAVFIDEEQIASLEKRMQRARLSGSPRHGDIVQHVARQRPHLVLRREQLSARKGAGSLRPPVLEFGLDPHARGHALLLSAQHVPAEPAGEARRNYSRRHADRSVEDQGTDIPPRRRARITLRHGNRPMRRRDFMPGPSNSSLSASGHMAGVISAPGSKYGHWTNDELPATPDAWLGGAKSHQGSWWPLWDEWVRHSASAGYRVRRAAAGSLRSRTRPDPTYV